jgi:hypothetical protein
LAASVATFGEEDAVGAKTGHPGLRELDQRKSDGLEVTLLWSERTGSVYVAVEGTDGRPGFSFSVEPADALDAFRHPYAYGRRVRLLNRSAERGAAAA